MRHLLISKNKMFKIKYLLGKGIHKCSSYVQNWNWSKETTLGGLCRVQLSNMSDKIKKKKQLEHSYFFVYSNYRFWKLVFSFKPLQKQWINFQFSLNTLFTVRKQSHFIICFLAACSNIILVWSSPLSSPFHLLCS